MNSLPLARLRKVIAVAWLIAVGVALGFYATHRSEFTPEQIATDLREWEEWILLIYLAASISRAIVLIPSTPFVLAGCLLFPSRPMTVLLLSLTGIAISASLIYFCAQSLGLGASFERRPTVSYLKLKSILQSRWGFWALAAWAAFPFAPTDLACYVAGTMRLHFGRFLASVCLGEAVICLFYILSSRAASQVFENL